MSGPLIRLGVELREGAEARVPLSELASPSPSPSPTLALPTMPGLATPALPTIPGLPGGTPVRTDELGLPALP